MSEENKVFGIDLGTTYSCIACLDDTGNPVVIKNMEGDNITPSVAYFESATNVVVGTEAKNTAELYPEQVVSFIKRSMGRPGFSFNHNGASITPEEISAYILKKVVGDAEKNLGREIKDVIISHPAYFGINEREATKNAGKIAGLNVISLIDEPVAAAITYGCTKGNENKVVLVYDLGGGTFDVTMIEITTGEINVICTGGASDLGGKSWDDAILTYIGGKFEEETGISADDLFNDMETLQELMVRAESAKKGLTQRDQVAIPVSFEGHKARIELTRDRFDEITADLLDRTIALTREMLEEAEAKGYNSFDQLLLVGGSTRMPQVAEKIKKELGVEPQVFDPDETVAKGAAIHGFTMVFEKEKLKKVRNLIGDETISDEELKQRIESGAVTQDTVTRAENELVSEGMVGRFGGRKEINPVTSKSFGVLAIDNKDQEKLFNLIVKNTTVPCEISKTFGTYRENQTDLDVYILENELTDDVIDPEMGVEIGKTHMELPPLLPANSPIDVTFKLNREGLLEMKAVERTDNRECNVTIQVTDGIGDDQLKEAAARSMRTAVS